MARRPVLLVALVSSLALGAALWAVSRLGGGEVAAVSELEPLGASPLASAEGGAAALARPAARASEPDAAPAISDPARRSAPRATRAVEPPPFDDPQWVRGRVVVPEDAPPEPALAVVAIGRRNEEVHRVLVEPDQTFRIAFPRDVRRGKLDLVADWLWLEDPVRVHVKGEPGIVVLEAQVGGRLVGRLTPPDEGPLLPEGMEGIEVGLTGGPSGEGGFVASMIGGPLRTTTLDREGRFAFGGLRPDYVWGLRSDPGAWAPLERDGLDVEPREVKEVEFAFSPGITVSGWVTDEGGAPIAGALVRTNPPRDRRFFLGDRLETDERGAFTVAGLRPGEREILAYKQGFRVGETALGELELGDRRSGVTVELERGETITGRVLWPDGTPAVGATVELDADFDPGGMGLFFDVARGGGRIETDADGRFERSGLELGTYTVSATANPRLQEGQSLRELLEKRAAGGLAVAEGVDPKAGPVVLRLRSGAGVVRGRVLTSDKRVLTRFRVRARPVEAGPGLLTNVLDSLDRPMRSGDGTFMLEGLEAGTWEVSAAAPGYGRSEEQRVELPGEERELVFELDPLATARGIVRDPAGEPVAKAQVRAVSREAGATGALTRTGSDDARTDEEGRFFLDEVLPGAVTLTAEKEGFGESAPFEVQVVGATELEDVELVLRAGGRLTGELHASVEEPGGRRVFVSGAGDWKTTSTDQGGRFDVDGLTPGTYTVNVGPPQDDPSAGFFGFRSGNLRAEVRIAEGESAHVVVGAPPVAGIAVRGRLLQGDEPVAGRTVSAQPTERREDRGAASRPATTGAGGEFELFVPDPGTYRLEVQSAHRIEGFGAFSRAETTFEREVPADGLADVVLELPGGRITGRVTGPEGPLVAAPVRLDVRASKDEDGRRTSDRFAQTDAVGRYVFDGLTAGEYVLRAGGVGGRRGFGAGAIEHGIVVTDAIELGADAVREGVDFQLAKPGTIDCRVLRPDGSEVGGARVHVLDAAGRDLEGSVRTNGRGRAQYRAAPPGTFTVRVREGEETVERGGVEVRSGEITSIEVWLGG